jgi:Domain of unknown function (DUF4440)
MCRNAMRFLAVGLLLAGSSGVCAGQAPQDDTAAKEVVKRAHTLSQAFVKGDADAIRRLLADDQIAIFGYGPPETKADQLKKLADLKFETASLEDVKPVPISKDVVAVSYKLVRKGTFKGKALTPEVYALAVWAKRDGQWQQVTYQETLPEKP